MKPFLILIFLIIACLTLQSKEIEKFKLIKVIDGDTVYVDFNKNGKADNFERIRINGIDAFETTIYHGSEYQMSKYNFTLNEVLGLGYLGTQFAKKELLNKYVKTYYSEVENYDKYNRKLMSIKYDKNKDYAEEILKAGLAKTYTPSCLSSGLKKYENVDKIKENALKTHNLKLVILNRNNRKCHKIDCKYGKMVSNKELIDISNKHNIRWAGCCKAHAFYSQKKTKRDYKFYFAR